MEITSFFAKSLEPRKRPVFNCNQVHASSVGRDRNVFAHFQVSGAGGAGDSIRSRSSQWLLRSM